MKDLKINITKAQLTGFDVTLAEGKPVVTASIALFSEGGKQISTYSIGTESWRSDSKFDLPVALMPLIGETARVLEAIAVRLCNDGQKALPTAATQTETETFANNVVAEDEKVELEVLKQINVDDLDF